MEELRERREPQSKPSSWKSDLDEEAEVPISKLSTAAPRNLDHMCLLSIDLSRNLGTVMAVDAEPQFGLGQAGLDWAGLRREKEGSRS